jgi:hypothetical protein
MVFDGKIEIFRMRRGFSLQLGTIDDAAKLAVLHTMVAEHLTNLHGRGPWSAKTSHKGVLYACGRLMFTLRDKAVRLLAHYD